MGNRALTATDMASTTASTAASCSIAQCKAALNRHLRQGCI